MARIPIPMPTIGYDMRTGKVVAWLCKVGDEVSRGDVIAEIETDKTTLELEATATGRLVAIAHEVGVDVPVGEPIAWLDDGTP